MLTKIDIKKSTRQQLNDELFRCFYLRLKVKTNAEIYELIDYENAIKKELKIKKF